MGEWQLTDDGLEFVIPENANVTNVLYCFVVDDEPKYIGKTTRPLKKRMYEHQNPGATQSTNIRINSLIKSVLNSGKKVLLYAFRDPELLHYGSFHINLAAGLEDSIVKNLAPPWNELGK